MATTMMTEEEKAEMERELNGGQPATTTPTPSVAAESSTPPAPPHSPIKTNGADAAASGSAEHSGAITPLPSPGEGSEQVGSGSGTVSPPHDKDTRRKKNKLTPEQKKKLQELEEERRKNMEERIDTLTKKLIERLRPFVEAKRPGDKDDPETKLFEEKIKREADDLKLESFGVEVCVVHLPHIRVFSQTSSHTVASTYNWQRVHDEGNDVHEVEEIPWHVSAQLLVVYCRYSNVSWLAPDSSHD